jgi:HAD superfamily hydrolase (TIGR01549 family)
MKKPTFIFDFDGTIADTQLYLVSIANKLADEFKFNKIQPGDIEKMENMTSKEVCRYLRVSRWKLPRILLRAKGEYLQAIHTIQPFEGMKEIIEELKELGHDVGIFSSNSVENVHKFLAHHELDLFDFIGCTHKIWGKKSGLKKIMKAEKIDRKTVIYVGDETRDIEAAKKAGIKVAAVTWGYNSEDLLSQFRPDFLCKSPQDLLTLNHLSA